MAGARLIVSCFVRRLAAAWLGLALAGAAAAQGGLFSEHNGGPPVAGSGRIVTEPRAVPPLRAVHLQSAMHLVVRQRAREAVEVRADDNLLALVETRVTERDGLPTLEIALRRGTGYATRERIVVTVDVVTLEALRVSGAGDALAEGLKVSGLKVRLDGSGDVALRGLEAQSLALALAGSGDVQASGRAGALAVSITGSGGVAASELPADRVDVSIAGSGDAQVHARRTLAVSIAGSGDVTYTGEATVSQAVAGSGTVSRR